MSAPIQIRRASAEDAAALSALLEQLGFTASADEIRTRLAGMRSAVLVAIRDGTVVGTATTNIMHVLHRPAPVGRLSALVVSESHRGAGIGRALVQATEEVLRAEGCGIVEVTSNLKRQRAHAFYKNLGYEITSYRFKKDLLHPRT